MNSFPRLLLLLVAVGTSTAYGNSPIVREAGVIYLSDFSQKPYEAQVKRAAPCYFDLDLRRYAGTLRFPQTVKVEAFAKHACKIRGNAQQGGVAAWVPYSELEGLPDNLLAELEKAESRRQTVETLIQQNEVAIGMTTDEVLRSVGKPNKKSSRAEPGKTSEKWEYIKYDLVPQTVYGPSYRRNTIRNTGKPYGNSLTTAETTYIGSTVYLKVPVGKLMVQFENGIVGSMEQTEGTLAERDISIVVPPVNVYY